MAQEIELHFYEEDDALNMSGSVNFPNSMEELEDTDSLTIRGLAEWRHAPANVIHVSHDFIQKFDMMNQNQKLNRVGLNWIGLQARSDILLSHSIRKGRKGPEKVKEQLNKLFRALGATSVKIYLEEDK